MSAMRTIIVGSTKPFAGKTGICVALLGELRERGIDAGYFKPYGTMPYRDGDVLTDRDAYYINSTLPKPAPMASVCAIVRSERFVEEVLLGREPTPSDRVADAFASVSVGHDVMVVEGPSDVFQGMTAGVHLCAVADLLDGRVLLVDHPEHLELPDAVLGAADCLGARLGGVVLNRIHESRSAEIADRVVPFYRGRNIPYFGMIEDDPTLGSITVAELVDELGGTVLCAEDRLDQPVESFMIGAMGQEKALRFFRRKARKAVITGGDRADVQLAALETSTSAVVLTGNMPPSSLVLARADQLGVPMVLVDMDTLTAVERLEGIMGQVRLHGPGKADRIREMFVAGVAVDDLLKAFGL
jgi:BioD-like phosphotransacetylase family protein